MFYKENHVFFKSNFLNFLTHKIYYSHLQTLTLNNCGKGKTAGKVLYPGTRKGWVDNPNPGRSTPGKETHYPLYRRLGFGVGLNGSGKSGPYRSLNLGLRSKYLVVIPITLFRPPKQHMRLSAT
jgi:hypothetical protein